MEWRSYNREEMEMETQRRQDEKRVTDWIENGDVIVRDENAILLHVSSNKKYVEEESFFFSTSLR